MNLRGKRKRHPRIPKSWRDRFKLIPGGYDPIATAHKDTFFDARVADEAVSFFHTVLTHMEGLLAGTPFILEPWQQAYVGCLFGWKRYDRLNRIIRRYRDSFLYVPRKNGKTPLVAGICNYVLFCDGDHGAQIYSAAGNVDQAALLFRHAQGMVNNEPLLRRRCDIYGEHGGGQNRSIMYRATNSFYRVVSAVAKTKHGFNPNLWIIDELHAQENRDLVDVFDTSMASVNRSQSMSIKVSTADFDRPSICNDVLDYAHKVRDRIIDDEKFLPMIYELPKDADIEDPRNWEIANPNLDVSVSREYIEDAVKKARHDQTYCDLIKRLHFNIKTDQSDSWLSLAVWDMNKGEVDIESLRGRECYGGLDLSTVNDITALVLAFPGDTGEYDLLCWFWVPTANAHVRERRDRVPYVSWSKEGLLELTKTKSVDFDVIFDKVVEVSSTYDLREIGYDPYNAAHLVSRLEKEDFRMEKFTQGWRQMSPAAKYFSQLLLDEKIRHGGNKVLRWMASNVAVEKSKEENIKMDKKGSTEKIDGIVAAIMAIGMASTRDTDQVSIYETQDIVVV